MHVNYATARESLSHTVQTVFPYCQQQLKLHISGCLVSLLHSPEFDSHKQPWMCLSFWKTAMIRVFRLGSGWRLTGGETQTGNLADGLSAKALWYMSKLWQDWDKKARPNLFHSVASLSFLWLAPACLSTAELLAASNQCVHCSLSRLHRSRPVAPSLSLSSHSLSLSARQVRY